MRRWDEQTETPMLRDLAGRLSVAEIAKRMGRGEATIQQQIKWRGFKAYNGRRGRGIWASPEWLEAGLFFGVSTQSMSGFSQKSA